MAWALMNTVVSEAAHTVAAAFFLLLSAFGFGSWTKRFMLLGLAVGERVLIAGILGFGLLGTVLFIAGLLCWKAVCIIPCIGVGAVLGLKEIVYEKKAFGYAIRLIWVEKTFWFLTAIIFFLFISSLAVPVGGSGHDGIAYHLLGPKVWAIDGLIHPVLDHSHTAFPAVVETLFAGCFLMGSSSACGAIGIFFFIMLAGQVYFLGRYFGANESVAAWAAAALVAMPIVFGMADEYFVDVPFAVFALAALRCALAGEGNKTVVAAGIFSGFCMGVKYTGIFVFLTTGLVLFLPLLGKRGFWKDKIGSGVLFAASAIVVAAPWYLRNYIVLGSPIYPPPPGICDIVDVVAMPREAVQHFHEYIHERGVGLGGGIGRFLSLPYDFTYNTAMFHGAGGIGLFPLAFAPVGVWVLRKNKAALLAGFWCLTLVVLWFLTQKEARFLIPVVASLTALGAVGLGAACEYGMTGTKTACVFVVAISLGMGSWVLYGAKKEKIASVFSAESKEIRKTNNIPRREVFDYLNGTDSVVRVMILNPHVPPYYLDKPYIKIEGPHGERPVPGIISAVDAVSKAKHLNVSHLWNAGDVPSEHLIGAGWMLTYKKMQDEVWEKNVR